jgi:acyl carrier protein
VSEHVEVLNRVIPAVAESLSIEAEEVQPSQTFFVDLKGESIEWLDLSFRLDKEFRARIPGIGNFANVETDADGSFTPAGIAALRAFLPATLIDRVKDRTPAPTAKELAEAITVDDVAGMVEMALESRRAAAAP